MKKIICIIYIIIIVISNGENMNEKRTIKVGFIKGFKPYYEKTEKGKYDGFGMEVIRELLEKNYNLDIIEIDNWQEGYERLKNSEIDLIPNMGITDQREKDYLLSIPYEDLKVSMFIKNLKKHDQIKTIEDAKDKDGYEVGVVKENIGRDIAEEYNFSKINIYEHYPEMLLSFMNEDVPIIIYPENVVNKDLKKLGKLKDYRRISPPLEIIPRAIGVNKNNNQLLLEINMGLANFIGSPRYNEIYSHWFVSNGRSYELTTGHKIIISTLIFLVIVSISFIILLKKIVNKKTEKLNETQALLENQNVRLEENVKKRTRELKKSRDYIKKLFDTAKVIILTADRQGKIINANKYFEELSGYKIEEIREKKWTKVLMPDKDIGTIQNKEKVVFQSNIKLKNGESKIIQWHNSNVYNETHNKEEILAVGIDITERKKIEKSLKESEERFKALHNASFGGIAIHDNGIILDCNKGLSEITGYTTEELMGINGLLLIAKESREYVMNKITSGYDKSYEAVGVRKNGEEYPLRLEAKNIPYKDKQVRVVEFRDITESVKAKKDLIVAKEKAEKANQAKSDFLANMSHELRTPLNAILGFSGLLKEMEEDKEKKDMADLIEESGEHLLLLINDILNLSKIEAGYIKVNIEKFKLEDILDDLKKSIEGIINRKDSNLDFYIVKENTIPKYIKADKLKIKQILMNLLSNAEKFTDNGKIELRVKYLKGERLRFKIIDTGIGISKENQNLIFDKFTQGEYYLTKQHEGTGLGLTINLKLVKLLGGHIEVESEEGMGSTFTVEIPIEEVSSENIYKLSRERSNYKEISNNKKVVVAEDDIINQKLTKRLCIKRGLDVDVVGNGLNLLEKLKKNNYDLILMDIQMPEMDGVEATKEIRKGGLQTPIIAVTAFAKKEDEDFFLEIGMNDYISKPIRRDKFNNILDKYLSLSNNS